MNKIFKVIWSKSKQCYIVVSEVAKNHSGKKKIVVASILAAMAVGADMSVSVNAGGLDGGTAASSGSIAIGNQSWAQGTQVDGKHGTIDPSIAIGVRAVAIGNSSLSIGLDTDIRNSYAVAVGRYSKVTGDYGIGIGYNTRSSLHGIAMGEQARSMKEGATTLGVSSRGYGKGAIAIGWQSLAGADVYTAGEPGNDINNDSSSKIDGYNSWGDMSVGLRAMATGGNATALGRNAAATAANAIAIGGGDGKSFDDNKERTVASGEKAAAIGYNSSASGKSASALGTKASATAENAAAIGTGASASAKDTLAAGSSAQATAAGATAVGKEAKAQKADATALGSGATASETNATALGKGATASKGDATAVGSGAQATEANAVAVGKGAEASKGNAIAIGKEAEATEASATAIGDGANAEKANAVAIGKGAISGGTSGIAMGNDAQAQAADTIAVGSSSRASNDNASAFGNAATAAGSGSTAIGYQANTTGANSTAIGAAAQSTKASATALGNGAKAFGTSAIAIGEGATVGIAEGRTTAGTTPAVDAPNSIAIGKNAKVLAGSGSIALGAGTEITASDVGTSSGAAQKTYPYMLTNTIGTDAVSDKENGIVAIGTKRSSSDTGFARRLTGVAGGVGDYDAVNLKQAKAIESSLKKGERHIKATSYSPDGSGTITLNYVDGEKKDVSNETATITDVAKKSVVDGINRTVNTHTTQISNLTTAVGGKVSQSDFDTFKAKAITFTGDDNAGVARTLDTTLTIKGGANYTSSTANTNIRVEKDGAAGLAVKLSDKLTGIKEIAGNGTDDLVIKNGTNTVTIKPGKTGDNGTVNFGNAKVVASNLEADITYRANSVQDIAANTVKLKKGLNFVSATDASTTAAGPKSGLSITTGADGLVTFGLDKNTRGAIDNAADKNLSNLSDDGKDKVKELAKTAAQDAVKVADGINTTVGTTTTAGVTTYKVNAIDTTVAVGSDALTINSATPDANKVRAYSVDLSDATKGKLAAVGNLANVIGGTTIAADGTVTGPTFSITKADGTNENANTLKAAIEKLNATNAGQNTKISETAGKVGTLETNVTNLGNTVTNLGNTVTNLGNTVTNNYNDLSSKITQAGTNVASTLTAKGLDFTGNDTTDKVHRDLGTTLTIQGAANFTRGGTETNNIKVEKNNDALDVKLAENLANIKEIAGDGSNDLVIKNGDTKVTVKAPKDGNTGSIDFGDTKLVAKNLEADIYYKAGNETAKKTVKLQTGFTFVAGDGTVAATTPAAGATTPAAGTATTTPAAGATTTTSSTTSTDEVATKKGIVISTAADGVVNIGLDSDTRSAIDNAANKDLSNLSTAGSNKVSDLAKAAAKKAVTVAPGINTTVDTDTTTTPGVTTYKVNAIDTTVAAGSDALTINNPTPDSTTKVRAYSLDLSAATKGKLAAVGNLANVIGGTTIAADGTVTGPTFSITKAEGGTDSVNTLKEAIEKLNATNEGQNTKISETAGKVGTLETNVTNLGNTVTNLGNTVTNLGNTVTSNYNDLSSKITQAGTNVASTLTAKGLDFTGNDTTDKVHRDLGTVLTIQGAENFMRGSTDHNIKVVKNGDALDVKLAENLGNIKEIAGDGTNDLVIKNGTNTVTITAGKTGDNGTVNFGNAKVVTSNLDADIAYKAGTETSKNKVKLADGFNFVAGTGTVAATTPATGATTPAAGTTTPAADTATTTSPTSSTDDKTAKKGIVISTEANGVVNIGLDSDTRSAIDNAASKSYVENALTNLNSTITGNANLNFAGNVTKDAQGHDANKIGLSLATGTLHIKGDATDITTTAKGDTVTIALTEGTQNKLKAIGNLANVIGGTTIAADGTVTGPTFNITKADGTNENANTLKEAIEKLNATNEGQNTKISETAGKVGTLETNVTNLGNTVTNLGNTVTNLGNTVTSNYNDLSNKISQAGTNVASTLTSKGLDFSGNDTADKVHRDLGTVLTIQGADNFTRGSTDHNIKVVKNGDALDVKLAENLAKIKEISGDGSNDLVIKNGDTKVTVKAPKDGNTGSIDFGDTKLVTKNLEADIAYKAGGETAKKTVKLQTGFTFVAGDGTVAATTPATGATTPAAGATTPAAGTATTTSPTASTDDKTAKKGIVISTENNGVVNIGLDSDTRSAIDNAASKNYVENALTNLNSTITNNANLNFAGNVTKDAQNNDANKIGLSLATGTLHIKGDATDITTTAKGDTVTIALTEGTQNKLKAIGNLANVIGGTTITTDGTVTGPTFNITNAAGGIDTANTLKDAIDKLNKTNEGQNTTISNLTDTVTNNYNDLSTKITNAGTAATAKGLNFTGDDTTDNGKVHRDLGDTLTIKGGENFARGASENNIKVVKTSNDLAVKLAENLGNIKEIAGDGTHDLVIKNGDTKVTVKAPKDGNTGSIDFGDTKLVTNNLDANISYKAGTETNKNTVKLQDGFNFVAGTGTVVPKHLEAGTTSPTEATDSVEPKKGIAISTAANGVVNIGLDSDTRGIIDNAASKDYVTTELANLNTTITGNANLNFAGNVTKDAQDADVAKVGLALATGTLHIKGDATDITTTAKGDTVTIALTSAAQGKLTAVGNLANIIGGTTITTDGTVTGPTFNITNAAGGTDTANTLKDAIDKLNKTNEGQNTTISNLTDTVTNNYNDLSTKITNAGTAATAKGLNFTGDDTTDNGKVHRDLGDTLTIKGGENFARGASENNIKVVKTSNDLAVKLAENLGNIKEIAGDGTHDLVIKNGDTKVTVKAPKDGNKGSIDFGDTKLITNNLDANISYKAGTETDKKTVKLQDGFNFVAGTGTVVPKHLEAGTTSPTEATDSVEPKKGIAISTAANGVVNIGLDSDTRGTIDNAADKNLSNLSEAGNNKITNLAKAAAKETVKVADGINTTVDTDTTTTEGVTTYKVNANDTKVAITGDGLAISGGDLGATDRVRTYTLDLSDATKGKLTAVGNLANVIGGTTIVADGTVTGPTFNITNATGGTDTANTLKDAIDKLNTTNAGQNTTISNLTDTVTNNYNDLSTKITNAGTAATAKGLNFTGDDTTDNGKVHRDLGDTLTIKGGENFARGASENNIKVVKTSNDLAVKLAENLGNIKEIAGDGTHDLVIKNGDTKVTVKAPKDGNTGSIDFGDTKLVTNNLDANISYKAGTEADKKTVKLQDGFNFVAGTGTVAATTPATGATTTTSPTASTDNKAAKKGIVISTEANGVVNIGLDSDTRGAIDNAADKNLSNLSEAGNNKITNLAKAAAKETVKVADGINTTVDTDTTTTEGVTTYKVNANDTKVAITGDGLAISGGDLGATDRVRTYTLDLSDATKGKLTAVGNLANVIGGTTITTDGTVTGPTFNITNATGGTDTANTLKDAIDKLNKTNEGQNTTISNLTDTVTNNYNDLSTKITNAGTAATAKGLNFTGDDTTDNGKVHRDLGDTLTIKGGENFARGASENNIKVVKTSNDLAVKLAENLGNIKEIAGDGTHDLVIKNGDTKVTVKAPKDGNKGSIDFGDTKLVTNNLDANISYKAGTETDKKTVKLQDGFNFVAGTGTVVPKHLEAGTVSPTEATDSVEPKKGIAISTAANGVVNIGLDSDTRGAIDNASNQDLSNLTTAGKKVITDAAQGSVKVAAGKNVTIDTETKDNVTTYTVNANDTLVTSDNTLVTVNGGTLGEDKVRTYTLGLSTAVTDKLAQLSAKNADGRDGKLGSEMDAIASKDIAKADGLNGETATYKVNALRHGEAGSVVYTDADGNRIVKATDGNYYKATEVNANGVVKTPAENNGVAPVAIEKATIVATLVNTDGTTAPEADDTNKVATTKLTNIKEAAITATSNDAVTGRQLYGLKSDLATYLGGDSKVNADGTFTGPTYNITKDDGTNTTGPVKNVGDAITKLDTRINNANTTLSTKGLDFYGNKDTADTDKVHRNLGEALKVKGAENFTREATAKNNIDVVKNATGDGFDVKLAENLGNIKEIAGNGTDNLVIKNGDATITVKPGKAGSTDPDTGTVTPPTNPSVDFGNTTLVVKNIEADITYRANNAEDADAHTVKLKKGLNFVAGTGTAAPKHLEAGTTSPTATTDSVEPKKGIVISTGANGVVNIGLDNDTRSAIDNAANQDLSNLTTAGKKVITDAAQGAVKVAAGNNITVDTETKDNVTKYTVNGRDTIVKAAENGSVSVTGGTLNDKGEREYIVDLTDATKAQINRIDGIDTRLTTAENNITTLQGDMKQAKQDITTLQGDMKQAKTDITVLQGDMKQAKQDITNNTNNIATNTQNITNNTKNIATNTQSIKDNKADIEKLKGNSANKDLSNLTNAGKDVVTGLVNVVGTNGITVKSDTDATSRVKTFTAKLDDKVTFGQGDKQITVDGTTGTITAPNATINIVNTSTVQVGDTNKTNTAVTSDGVTVTTKQPDGTVTSTVIIKDGTVSGLTNTKWDPTKVTDTDRSKAATQGQMKDVSDTLQKGRVFAADTGVASTTVALGDTLAIKGGAKDRLTDNNIGVELTAATAKEPATMTVRLAKDMKMKDGSTSYEYYKRDKAGKETLASTTLVNGTGIGIAPAEGGKEAIVTLTADGLDNGGNAIHNVGPGTAPNDAATVGQVSAAAGTLSRRVNEVGAHAAALAAMNPLSYDPLKKSQVMAGYGSYKGNSALALGVAHYANEDTLFNVGVSVGNGENMVNAGVTYRFGGEDSMIPERYKGGPISSVYVMQDEITALKAENARKDVENAKKQAENEEMKAQIKMLIERVTMLEAKK